MFCYKMSFSAYRAGEAIFQENLSIEIPGTLCISRKLLVGICVFGCVRNSAINLPQLTAAVLSPFHPFSYRNDALMCCFFQVRELKERPGVQELNLILLERKKHNFSNNFVCFRSWNRISQVGSDPQGSSNPTPCSPQDYLKVNLGITDLKNQNQTKQQKNSSKLISCGCSKLAKGCICHAGTKVNDGLS